MKQCDPRLHICERGNDFCACIDVVCLLICLASQNWKVQFKLNLEQIILFRTGYPVLVVQHSDS